MTKPSPARASMRLPYKPSWIERARRVSTWFTGIACLLTFTDFAVQLWRAL